MRLHTCIWPAKGNLLTPAVIIGPTVLGLTMWFLVVCIAIPLLSSDRKSGAPFFRVTPLAIFIGIAGFAVGTMAGIAASCSFAKSGNLCGLGGIFFVGPLVSGACMAR
ncbi:MAG: hypothetical protein ABIQ70_09850, partial [Dokdonella sp.]